MYSEYQLQKETMGIQYYVDCDLMDLKLWVISDDKWPILGRHEIWIARK